MEETPATPAGPVTFTARLRALLSITLRVKLLRRPELALWQLLLAAGSGLVLSLAYLGPAIPELAFLAPAVFLYVISRERVTPGAASLLGTAFGLAFTGPGLAWIGGVTWFGWAGVVLVIAATFAAMAAAVSFVVRRLNAPVAAVAPVGWVAIEYIRSLVFTGFPWLFLGHALSDRLVLIQIADLGGAYLVTFVAALVASALAEIFRQWERAPRGLGRWGAGWASAAAAGAVLAFTIPYGAYRLATIQITHGPRLVLVQGNIYTPGAETDEERDALNKEIPRVLGELSRRAVRTSGGPDLPGRACGTDRAEKSDLLVWSESMIFCYYNDPEDPDAAVWRRRLRALLGEIGLPLLAGSSATDKNVPGGYGPERRLDYNSAFLLTEEAEIAGRYDKIHLVAFGEYVPLATWPLFADFTPYAADDPGYAHGSPDQPLITWRDARTGRTWRFGVLICYEDVFPELARRAARQGTDLLVNLSSEVWFAGSAEIPQHFRISRFRAVETRLPLVRCCNVGVTCFVDPAGRVRGMLAGSDRVVPAEQGARGTIVGAVPVPARRVSTVYVRTGDLFAVAAVVALAAFLVWAAVRGRQGRKEAARA